MKRIHLSTDNQPTTPRPGRPPLWLAGVLTVGLMFFSAACGPNAPAKAGDLEQVTAQNTADEVATRKEMMTQKDMTELRNTLGLIRMDIAGLKSPTTGGTADAACQKRDEALSGKFDYKTGLAVDKSDWLIIKAAALPDGCGIYMANVVNLKDPPSALKKRNMMDGVLVSFTYDYPSANTVYTRSATQQ